VNFAVLGGSAVTNTGTTPINGDIGVSGTSAYTAGGIAQTGGTVYLNDAVAHTAEDDVFTNANSAYATLAALSVPVGNVLTGTNLGGLTLLPGVYYFHDAAALTGTLILNANYDPNALFVFQIGSTLDTAAGSSVQVTHGGAGVGVFWQVGSTATLGANTLFLGNILADTSINLGNEATICGRALAQTGAVALDTNTISDACGAPSAFNSGHGDFGSLGFAGLTVPEPGTVPLLSVGLLALSLCGWQSRKRVA
jgi:type VI secretion system secreted protein VgrG